MAYELGDILNAILGAVQDILGNIASAIADNAGIIASIVVLGGLTALVIRYGTDIFGRLGGMLSSFTAGLF